MPGWTLADYSSLLTAVGVLLGALQVRQSVRQARVDFEDDLSREFRELSKAIPPIARFDGQMTDTEFNAAFPAIYQYFDLTNEQVFLRMNGRIGRTTWLDWCQGIRATLAKPAFRRAWVQVLDTSTSFSELRRLASGQFQEDPYYWVSRGRRLRRWLFE